MKPKFTQWKQELHCSTFIFNFSRFREMQSINIDHGTQSNSTFIAIALQKTQVTAQLCVFCKGGPPPFATDFAVSDMQTWLASVACPGDQCAALTLCVAE